MLTIITVVGVKHKLPSNIAWSEMCQTNKEIGGHIAKFGQKMANGQLLFSFLAYQLNIIITAANYKPLLIIEGISAYIT